MHRAATGPASVWAITKEGVIARRSVVGVYTAAGFRIAAVIRAIIKIITIYGYI
jgi:hypothetical protein